MKEKSTITLAQQKHMMRNMKVTNIHLKKIMNRSVLKLTSRTWYRLPISRVLGGSGNPVSAQAHAGGTYI